MKRSRPTSIEGVIPKWGKGSKSRRILIDYFSLLQKLDLVGQVFLKAKKKEQSILLVDMVAVDYEVEEMCTALGIPYGKK